MNYIYVHPSYFVLTEYKPHVAATYDQEANDKEKEETQAGIHTEWHLKNAILKRGGIQGGERQPHSN